MEHEKREWMSDVEYRVLLERMAEEAESRRPWIDPEIEEFIDRERQSMYAHFCLTRRNEGELEVYLYELRKLGERCLGMTEFELLYDGDEAKEARWNLSLFAIRLIREGYLRPVVARRFPGTIAGQMTKGITDYAPEPPEHTERPERTTFTARLRQWLNHP
jgi:hypothetical protein